jgi:hypothetical protein
MGINFVAGPQSLRHSKTRIRGQRETCFGTIYGHCPRIENSGMTRTISSGGRVCVRRDRIVGPRLPIRSGTVESEAITRRSFDVLPFAKVSRMKQTCRRRVLTFLMTGNRCLRPSAPRITRTNEISGHIRTRSTARSCRSSLVRVAVPVRYAGPLASKR